LVNIACSGNGNCCKTLKHAPQAGYTVWLETCMDSGLQRVSISYKLLLNFTKSLKPALYTDFSQNRYTVKLSQIPKCSLQAALRVLGGYGKNRSRVSSLKNYSAKTAPETQSYQRFAGFTYISQTPSISQKACRRNA